MTDDPEAFADEKSVDTDERGGAGADRGQVPWAGATVLAFLGFLGLLATIGLFLFGPGTAEIVEGLGYLFAALAAQVVIIRPGGGTRGAARYVALLVQAVAVYAPILQFGDWWVGVSGLLVGSVLLMNSGWCRGCWRPGWWSASARWRPPTAAPCRSSSSAPPLPSPG